MTPPLPQLSLCMSSKSTTVLTLNNKLHVPACGHLSCHGYSWGGECNRSPLIIFNTAVAERLKTKSQLRKELWGRSSPPPPPLPPCRDGGWEDFGFRLHLWPQSTKSPSSLFLSGQQIFIYMPPPPLLLIHPSSFYFGLNCSQICLFHIKIASDDAAQQHLQWLTYNPPPPKEIAAPKISLFQFLTKWHYTIPQAYRHTEVLKDLKISKLHEATSFV